MGLLYNMIRLVQLVSRSRYWYGFVDYQLWEVVGGVRYLVQQPASRGVLHD